MVWLLDLNSGLENRLDLQVDHVDYFSTDSTWQSFDRLNRLTRSTTGYITSNKPARWFHARESYDRSCRC